MLLRYFSFFPAVVKALPPEAPSGPFVFLVLLREKEIEEHNKITCLISPKGTYGHSLFGRITVTIKILLVTYGIETLS